MAKVPTNNASPQLLSSLSNTQASGTISNTAGMRAFNSSRSEAEGSSRRSHFLSSAAFHLNNAYEAGRDFQRHNVFGPPQMVDKPYQSDVGQN